VTKIPGALRAVHIVHSSGRLCLLSWAFAHPNDTLGAAAVDVDRKQLNDPIWTIHEIIFATPRSAVDKPSAGSYCSYSIMDELQEELDWYYPECKSSEQMGHFWL